MTSLNDDDAPLIYGLEFQARALASQLAESEITRFMVGTQTLKMANNQIHVVELNDETGALYTKVYSHNVGEVWWLHWSPHDPSLFTSVYNAQTENGCEMRTRLWRLPQSETETELESVADLPVSQDIGNVKSTTFHPSDTNLAATIAENKFLVWDFGKDQPNTVITGVLDGKGHQKMTTGKWNPQESASQLATVQETSVKGWDLRAGTTKHAWTIEQAHSQLVRDVDYNRNRQYFVGTCGDDGACRFWDVRHVKSPVVTLTHHSHWVWCLRYNACHDQLVVSASSDARVVLASVVSIASEPVSEDDTTDDGLLVSYDHHEDSVYCVEWSPVDPWCFASLSYDGRLLINRVPKAHKYRILGI